MRIKTIVVGPLRNNCFVVSDELSDEAVVIDPGSEAHKIIPELSGLKIKYIVLTHDHYDHVGAVEAVKQAAGAPLFSGDEVRFGSITLKVIKTPGHTSDSLCFYTPGHLFSGDTLFEGAHGRVDLPGSSPREMVKSLRLLAQLPEETIVYPGHEDFTTIGQEKESGVLG